MKKKAPKVAVNLADLRSQSGIATVRDVFKDAGFGMAEAGKDGWKLTHHGQLIPGVAPDFFTGLANEPNIVVDHVNDVMIFEEQN